MKTAVLAMAWLSAGALAQGPSLPLQGLIHNLDSPTLGAGLSLFIRGAQPPEELLQRIDTDDHIDWAVNAAGDVEL